MALDVWYPKDILNALLAAEQAANDTATATGNNADDPFAAGFLIGYRAALTTLGLAFGLADRNNGRPQLEPWWAGVLALNRVG